jgi:hypothetical protein
VQRYNTGNVSSARLRGETISNTKAEALLWTLTGTGKLYFDLADGRFHGQGLSQADVDVLVAAIRATLEGAHG